MTPPHDPPRPALRLLGARPIPREDAQEELPPPVVAPDPLRLDTVIEDLRGVAPRLRRVERRQRRSVRVQLGTARAVRRIAADVRAGREESAEADGRLAADVSRALAPYRRRASVSAWGSTLTTIIAVLYALAQLLGD